MESAPTWRHPLDKDPNVSIPDEETTSQYSADILNYRLVKREYSHPFVLRDQTAEPGTSLSLAECHNFCGKAAAMYATVDIDHVQVGMLNTLYPTWFSIVKIEDTPARNYAQFAMKFIASYYEDSPKTLAAIIKAHDALVKQVESGLSQGITGTPEQFTYADDIKHHGHYKLLPTLKDVLVICDSARTDVDGALLVLLDPSRAVQIPELGEMGTVDTEGSPVRTLRAKVHDIMRLITAMK
ncbi:MAG: hypothetical protein M1831_005583 [Alyxoria varia]|nr:MAG: hypothetical protein M1831_005583 [Alyxoria varia]